MNGKTMLLAALVVVVMFATGAWVSAPQEEEEEIRRWIQSILAGPALDPSVLAAQPIDDETGLPVLTYQYTLGANAGAFTEEDAAAAIAAIPALFDLELGVDYVIRSDGAAFSQWCDAAADVFCYGAFNVRMNVDMGGCACYVWCLYPRSLNGWAEGVPCM